VNSVKKFFSDAQKMSLNVFWFFCCLFLLSFINIEYLIYSFVLRGRRVGGLANAKLLSLGFFLSFLFSFTNIEYLFYSLSCADGAQRGLQTRTPSVNSPAFLRLLLGSVFAYGSLGY